MSNVRHISPNGANTLVLNDRVLITVETPDGSPVPGIDCEITFGDGRVAKGRTDNRGNFVALHDLEEGADVTVEFPRLSGAAWEPGET